MKRNVWFLAVALLLILVGCTAKPATPIETPIETPPPAEEETTNEPAEPEITEEVEEEVVEEEEPAGPTSGTLLDYFLPDDTSAYYEGEGNEFAQLAITVSRPVQDYVVIHEDNGGSYMQKVYKLVGNEIKLLKEEPVDPNVLMPTATELNALTPIGTYLKEPIAVGTTFGDWTIIEINASLQTPYQQFGNVVVMEQQGPDYINKIYLAEGYGEIKRESIMTITGEPDYVVTSTLENVTQP